MKKALPLAISSLSEIIQHDYIYVDKTQHAYNLINRRTGSKYIFLSRPRRFGKSLFVDTLKQIFLGKKELFKNLLIYKSDWDWQEHPIIHIDFSELEKLSTESLYKDFMTKLDDTARQYSKNISSGQTLSSRFSTLIRAIAGKTGVVILIDEYDKPILDNMQDIKKAEEIRDLLKSFYEIIKANDAHIRFLFMTGVTKFSQMSIFSGLNNLNDISFDERYPDITGYNQQELELNFQSYVAHATQKLHIEPIILLQEIKKWYNGYRFSDSEITVYNPFSILNFFDKNKFSNYWFASGTPSFLIKLLKKQYPDFEKTLHSKNVVGFFSAFDLENLAIAPILYQGGYITITGYDPTTRHYTLGYPNFEVEEAFTKVILESLIHANQYQVSTLGAELF